MAGLKFCWLRSLHSLRKLAAPKPSAAWSSSGSRRRHRSKWKIGVGSVAVRRLLRFAELLFQIVHQLLEALRGDGIAEQGNRPLGLIQAPLQFFAVALFIHGDAPRPSRISRNGRPR